MIQSSWSNLQREALDRQAWGSRAALGSAIVEWTGALSPIPPAALRARLLVPDPVPGLPPPRSPRH